MSEHRGRERGTPGVLNPPTVMAEWFDEPALGFGGGRLHVDQKTGLTLFGPRSLDMGARHPDVIKVGFVGSGKSTGLAKAWIDSCLYGVQAEREKGIAFPGFTEDVGFLSRLQFSKEWEQTISEQEIDGVREARFHRDRFTIALALVSEKMRLLSQSDHPPTVVVLALPDELLEHCKTADYSDPELGTVHRDFRRALKSELMKHQLPTQILLQRTTEAAPNSRTVDPRSVCAWNAFTGLFFKAGGVPWVPTTLRAGTCYVGVSFYKPIGSERSGQTQTSMAQAFDEHGEGLVLRGPEFSWDSKEFGRSPHLNEAQAEQLLNGLLAQYRNQMGQLPERVVVHKTSRYWKDEEKGFKTSLKKVGVPLFDFVPVHPTSEIRLLRKGKYPPLRGTHFSLNDIHFLYTTGFIPALASYPHGHVPSPLQVADHKGDSPIEEVLREILVLTRMNWNSANFAISTPITLKFAKLVADVLREIPDDREPLPQFKFYI